MKPESCNAAPTALDETIVPIDYEWAEHRESGLCVRKLRGKTVLKQRYDQWLFEVTNGLFSAVFLYEKWPTYEQPIRKGLAVFGELFPVGDAQVGHERVRVGRTVRSGMDAAGAVRRARRAVAGVARAVGRERPAAHRDGPDPAAGVESPGHDAPLFFPPGDGRRGLRCAVRARERDDRDRHLQPFGAADAPARLDHRDGPEARARRDRRQRVDR